MGTGKSTLAKTAVNYLAERNLTSCIYVGALSNDLNELYQAAVEQGPSLPPHFAHLSLKDQFAEIKKRLGKVLIFFDGCDRVVESDAFAITIREMLD